MGRQTYRWLNLLTMITTITCLHILREKERKIMIIRKDKREGKSGEREIKKEREKEGERERKKEKERE